LSEGRGTTELEATLRVRCSGRAEAESIMRAVSPDNLQAPEGITLRTCVENGELVIRVSCSRRIGSLVATLDDLISCIQAAERAIEGLKGSSPGVTC